MFFFFWGECLLLYLLSSTCDCHCGCSSLTSSASSTASSQSGGLGTNRKKSIPLSIRNLKRKHKKKRTKFSREFKPGDRWVEFLLFPFFAAFPGETTASVCLFRLSLVCQVADVSTCLTVTLELDNTHIRTFRANSWLCHFLNYTASHSVVLNQRHHDTAGFLLFAI